MQARPMTPEQSRQSAKGCLIVLGVLVGIALVVVTYGLALIPIIGGWIWWVHNQHGKPAYRASQLITKAKTLPEPEAVRLLHEAIDLDPEGAATLLGCAGWFATHGCWPDAADAYAGYLHLANSDAYGRQYAYALLASGHTDEAIAELEQLRAAHGGAPEILAQLGMAFLRKEEPGQALAIVNTAPLQRHQLEPELEKCLFIRAVSRYQLGERSKGIADLERLYALNPSFPGIQQAKADMAARTFEIKAPDPLPNWYPATVEIREGPELEEVADGHADELPPNTVSDDGRWRWDGTAWVSTEPGGLGSEGIQGPSSAVEPATSQTAPPQAISSEPGPRPGPSAGTFSADGAWYWDGSRWTSAISPDGLSRWNGTEWVRNQ